MKTHLNKIHPEPNVLCEQQSEDKSPVPAQILPINTFSEFKIDFLRIPNEELGQISLETLFSNNPEVRQIREIIESQLKRHHREEAWEFLQTIYELNSQPNLSPRSFRKKLEMFCNQYFGKLDEIKSETAIAASETTATQTDTHIKVAPKMGASATEILMASSIDSEKQLSTHTSSEARDLQPKLQRTTSNLKDMKSPTPMNLSLPKLNIAHLFKGSMSAPTTPRSKIGTGKYEPLETVRNTINIQDTLTNHINAIRAAGQIQLADFNSSVSSLNVLQAVYILLIHNLSITDLMKKTVLKYYFTKLITKEFIQDDTINKSCGIKFFSCTDVNANYAKAVWKAKTLIETIDSQFFDSEKSKNNEPSPVNVTTLEESYQALLTLEKNKKLKTKTVFSSEVRNIIKLLESYNSHLDTSRSKKVFTFEMKK